MANQKNIFSKILLDSFPIAQSFLPTIGLAPFLALLKAAEAQRGGEARSKMSKMCWWSRKFRNQINIQPQSAHRIRLSNYMSKCVGQCFAMAYKIKLEQYCRRHPVGSQRSSHQTKYYYKGKSRPSIPVVAGGSYFNFATESMMHIHPTTPLFMSIISTMPSG